MGCHMLVTGLNANIFSSVAIDGIQKRSSFTLLCACKKMNYYAKRIGCCCFERVCEEMLKTIHLASHLGESRDIYMVL